MKSKLFSGLVGLAISYALSITSLLSGVVNYFAETEKQMVSVERAAQYIEGIPGEQEDALLCVSHLYTLNTECGRIDIACWQHLSLKICALKYSQIL